MNALPALSLLSGRTTHSRFTPFEQRFSYALFMVDLDIDRLGEASDQNALFSIDRPNLFSFRRADHGAREDVALRPWAEDMFATAGVDLEGGAIRLASFPRHLFYKFAPISLWRGYGPDGALRGVIYEVNNTFGETHAYVAPVDALVSRHDAEKAFHVSPFFDVTGRYRFTLRAPSDRLDLVVDTLVDGTRTHMANIKTRRQPATSKALARAAVARPLSTLGVTFGIHLEALKLWLKGAGYRSRPKRPEQAYTVARTLTPRILEDTQGQG